MITFKEFLVEIWHDTMSTPYKNSKDVDIYKNPSKHEVDNIINNSEAKTARGIIHGKHLYVWDAMHAAHHDVVDHLGLVNIHRRLPQIRPGFRSDKRDHFNIHRDRISSEYLSGTSGEHVTKHPWVASTLPNHRFFHG